MTNHPIPAGQVLVPVEPTDAWVSRMANLRQGRSSTPRCEPPSDYDLEWCRDRIREVLAAAPSTPDTRSADVPVGWQPIETAPRDGTDVLVWSGNFKGKAEIARWSDDRYASKPIPRWETLNRVYGRRAFVEFPPTHWMPLPPSPDSATLSPTHTVSDMGVDALRAARIAGGMAQAFGRLAVSTRYEQADREKWSAAQDDAQEIVTLLARSLLNKGNDDGK